jgi:S1-C subfamily serine protease
LKVDKRAWLVAMAVSLVAYLTSADVSAQSAAAPQPAPAPAPAPALAPASPVPETPPVPPAQPTPDATRAADVESECESQWFIRVYRHAYRSVVRIDTGGGLGAGFVFHSQKYVATAFHVVSLGRSIEVSFSDGTTTDAEIVAIDREHDLAILELETPAHVPPLLPATRERVALGTPVLAIGHPYATVDAELEGLLSWSVSQGIISGRGERLLQTDAALNPGNSGGPLLGCDGRVLGVVSAKLQAEGIGFVIPSRMLVALVSDIGKQPPFSGDWRLSPGLGLLFQGNPEEALLGFEINLGLQIYDRWETRLRYGPLWSVSQEEPPPNVFDQSRMRHALQLDAGYRFMLRERPFPVYFGVYIGGAATRTQTDQTLLTGTPQDPACTGVGCPFVVQRADVEEAAWMGYPVVGVHLELFGMLDLSYAFLPDVIDVKLSLHRAFLGISL